MPPEDTTAVPAAAPIAVPAPESPAPVPTPPAAAADAGATVSPAVAPPTPGAEVPAVVEPEAPEAAAPALKPHSDEPGLLGAEPVKEGAKEEATDPAKPTETQGAEPVKYESPVVPEGIRLDPERLAAADTVFRELGIAADGRQRLVDLYIAERQSDAARMLQAQHDAFAETRASWREAAKGDPEIGGSGFRSSLDAANRMIRLFFPDQAERTRYIDALNAMGASDHGEIIRAWTRVARKFDEASPAPLPHRPPPDIGKRQAANGRLRDYYDNPRSLDVMNPGSR